MPVAAGQRESQALYHLPLFTALDRWDEVWAFALELAGDAEGASRLALDQLGHFGPHGVQRVVDRLLQASEGPLQCVVELGSGFGGALRHARRLLVAAGVDAACIGIELVPQHCEVALRIGKAAGDVRAHYLCADVARLPLAAGSVDAVFAAGSASHFAAMGATLAECARVLRPGGVLVMTEEVSLRPAGAPPASAAFVSHHPPTAFFASTPARRRAEIEACGLSIECFESLSQWAVPLLRQRVHALQLLRHCAEQIFGTEGYDWIAGTLASAADEYERQGLMPALVVARRPRA